jgi:hypothetical protein
VGREPADQLLARRHRRILEHAPRRLRKHLRAPWHEGRDGCRPPPDQAVCLLRNLGVEVRRNLPGLRTHLPGQVEQALVVLLNLLGRLRRRVTQLLTHLAHPARAVAAAGAGPRDGSFAEGPGAAEGARAHARAVDEQGAVDGIVHVRYDQGDAHGSAGWMRLARRSRVVSSGTLAV